MNKKLITYNELVEISKKFDLDFNLELVESDSLKLSTSYHPWSIKEHESVIIYNTIISNNLKYGYEVATAFGVSSCIIGLALNITNGKLITLDSYVEENTGNCNSYDITTNQVYENSKGFILAKKLINFLNLENRIFMEVGWSPYVVDEIIKKHLIDTKLDFAFIDGGHTVSQIDADVKSIINYINNDGLIILHDFHCVGEKTKLFLYDNGFNNFKDFNTGFKLVMFSRGNIYI